MSGPHVRITVGPPGRQAQGLLSALRWTRDEFRRWRRTRPFWGGFWCIVGGAIIAYGPTTAVKIVLVSGTIVWLGILMGALVAAMGLFLWFAPNLRHLVGILAAAFSLASLLTSDYGGFLIGLILGSLGGAMGFAWTPAKPQKAAERQQ